MRNPENELYDAACELLSAALRFRRAAAAGRVEPAIPATLGCVAASLGSLAEGCTLLHGQANGVPRELFADLLRALRWAERTCDAARSSSAALAR